VPGGVGLDLATLSCHIDLDARVPHPTTLMKITTRCGDAEVVELNEALLAKAVAAKVVRTGRSGPTSPWR
jgi:hypothetical protein